jgi:hypothetical protein
LLGRFGGDSSRLLPELWLPIWARSITGTGASEVMPRFHGPFPLYFHPIGE